MNPTPLDRGAAIVLDGILRELPKIGADTLDALLARVSLLYRRRTEKDASEEEVGVTRVVDVMTMEDEER